MIRFEIDLDDYTLTKNIGDTDGIIHPATRKDGTRPSPILYAAKTKRGKDPRVTAAMIVNGEAKWRPAVEIDPNAKPVDYLACIDWWFMNANKEENKDYTNMLSENYPTINVMDAIKEIRSQLENYHTYTSVSGGGKITYTKRHKSISRKITTLLIKWRKTGRFGRTR